MDSWLGQYPCGFRGGSALGYELDAPSGWRCDKLQKNFKAKTAMNKTFTAAIVLASAASVTLAAIETENVAGYTTTAASGGQYVCNPFDSFVNGTATTLGDIDGSNLDKSVDSIVILSNTGKKILTAKYLVAGDTYASEGAGWYEYANNAYGDFTNSFPLARGMAVQFSGSSGDPLVLAGNLNSEATQFTLVSGYNFVGNATIADKTLADVTLGGAYNKSVDFLTLNGVKYTYLPTAVAGLAKGWYLYNDIRAGITSAESQNSVSIPSAKGFIIYTRKAGATISITGAN